MRATRRLLNRIRQQRKRLSEPPSPSASPSLPLLDWAARYLAPAFHLPPSRFHRWLADELDGLRSRRGQRLSVQAARGAAKSTYASLAYPLREALEGREPFILITSDTGPQAEQFLRAIRDNLESNEALLRDYPHAAGKGPFWREKHIRLRNGVEILALGTGGKVRGRKTVSNRRPTLVLADDPQNKDHIFSALKRSRSWEWFTKDLLSVGEPDTNFVILGTALHREAIVCRLEKMPGWRSSKWPAILSWPARMDLWREWADVLHDYGMDDAEREAAALAFYQEHRRAMDAGADCLWPERFPLYDLMLRRASDGEAAFDSEYQGSPIDPAMCLWAPDLFDWPGIYFHDWPEQLLVKTIAWDPSVGRSSKLGDYSAIVLFGRDREGREYMECEAAQGRSVEIMCDFLVEHVRTFRPDVVAIEANTFQELCAIPLRYAAQKAGVEMPPIRLVYNNGHKAARIQRLGSPLSQKRIRFKARSPGTATLLQQFRDYGPPDVHDDCLDAAEMARRVAIETLEKKVTPRRQSYNRVST